MAGASSTFGSGAFDAFSDGSYDPGIADAVNKIQVSGSIYPPIGSITAPVAQTCEDNMVQTTLTLTTATVQVTLIGLTKGQVVTNVNLNSNAASSTATHCWAAITTTGASTVLAVTTDLGTTNTPANAVQSLTLSPAWTVPTTGTYYVHVAAVATGTVATFDGFAATSGLRASQKPIIAGTGSTSVTAPPAVGGTLSTLLTATKGLYVVLN